MQSAALALTSPLPKFTSASFQGERFPARTTPQARPRCFPVSAAMPSAAVLPPLMAGQLSSQTNRAQRKSDPSKKLKASKAVASLIEAPISDKPAPGVAAIPQVLVETMRAGQMGTSTLAGNAVYGAERNLFEHQLNSLDLSIIQEPSKEQIEANKSPRPDIIARSVTILRENDFGGYTIPAKGLYPYQWNWDSALVAMGWATFNEGRAWEELESLFSAQWSDGMVPHIVFHRPCSTYFPGPDTWQAGSGSHSSTGITQPPVAAISVRRIVEGSSKREAALRRAGGLFGKLMRWHRWFVTARDPEGRGLVATLHPWESGMDNSPMWDEALMAVPVDAIPPYTRKDLGHVDSAMRPKQAEYDRYLTLLYRFRAVGYDPAQLYHMSPFRVSDICTNSVLHRANRDLRWLALQLNETTAVFEIDSWLERSRVGFETLYDSTAGIYRSQNQLTGSLIPAATSGGFLPLFAGVASTDQASALARTLEKWVDSVRYSVPSFDPAESRFEPLRYWRGPVWAIVNWMISDGLRSYGYHKLADRIVSDTRTLTRSSGMYEYFSPVNGDGAGGNNFSWTAAMCLMWLDRKTEPEN